MSLYIPTWFLIVWLSLMFIGLIMNIVAFKAASNKASKQITDILISSISNAVDKEVSAKLEDRDKKCKSTQKLESASQKSQKK